MVEPLLPLDGAGNATPILPIPGSDPAINAVAEPTIPEQYELLLSKLVRAERDLEVDGVVGGRSSHLEEASGIVFDLLYSLDYKHGGELVPRLAALYGYIANELLNVGRTGDRLQLSHLRDMVTTLRQSWLGQDAA